MKPPSAAVTFRGRRVRLDYRAPGCPWCGEAVAEKRRSWHPECVQSYRLAAWPATMRDFVFRRDQGVCGQCGFDAKTALRTVRPYGNVESSSYEDRTVTRFCWVTFDIAEWHADHRTPLWSVDCSAAAAWRFWSPDNVQTLCGPCHKAKTAREAGERAARKRPQQALPLGAVA